MKNHSLAVTLCPNRGDSPDENAGRPAPVRRKARSAARSRDSASMIRVVLEIAGETLWVVLLFLVIGFLLSKAPQIDAAIDEISGVHAPVSPTDASREAQIRDLEARFARYETKLAPIEKGYEQLKRRHADLLKAYAELQKSRVREAYVPVAETRPAGAP